jgi:glutamate-ammonia-ligase adenylyltransferase
MKPDAIAFKKMCPDVSDDIIKGHISRLEDHYFNTFSNYEIAEHIRGIARLSPAKPVALLFNTAETQNFISCTVVAFDYPSEFSLITGVLSALGLNIESGDVFTYSPATLTADKKHFKGDEKDYMRYFRRRKIVDRFTGVITTDLSASEWQIECSRQILKVLSLLEETPSAPATARKIVNEMVAERLADTLAEEIGESFLPHLYPVDIKIEQVEKYTRLTVISQDTPAFLYSLSTALAIQGLSIEHVRIRTISGRIEDVIDILDSKGDKILDKKKLSSIKLITLLTKQFTYFLFNAPDPNVALFRFEQMAEEIVRLHDNEKFFELLSDPLALKDLAKVLGTSDFLWEDFIRLQYETLIPMFSSHIGAKCFSHSSEEVAKELSKIVTSNKSFEQKVSDLNQFKDKEIFLIDMDQIVAPAPDVRLFAEKLTRLAEAIVDAAAAIAFRYLLSRYGKPLTVAGLETPWAIMGLGKFGGEALGYASDIELLFIYQDNGTTDGREVIENSEFFSLMVKLIVEIIKTKREGIFHVDTRLRPYGASGPLASSLASFCEYYSPEGPARSYEKLALVRLRYVAGDRELGTRVERIRDEFVYNSHSIDISSIQELRKKQIMEKSVPGRFNAKFSAGALVDIEYDVQLLQILHSSASAELKTPSIHKALEVLSRIGVLTEEEGENLIGAYEFFRRLINGLRMLRGSARDLFLPEEGSLEFLHLARRMGYSRKGELSPEQQLKIDFETYSAFVRAFIEKHFGLMHLLEKRTAVSIADLVMSDKNDVSHFQELLSSIGFQDVKRAFDNIKNLANSSPSPKKNFSKLSVLMMDFLMKSIDPDRALNNWERFVNALQTPQQHFEHLLLQPRRFELLLGILSSSQFLAEILIKNPAFFDWATDSKIVRSIRTRDEMLAELEKLEPDLWLKNVRTFRKRELLRIGTKDIYLKVPLENVVSDLSLLAEVAIEYVLKYVMKESLKIHSIDIKNLAVLAFGKLGGNELNYSSDIDLLGVSSSVDSQQLQALSNVMQKLSGALSKHTEDGYAYRVDFRLRPYGSAGHIVYSMESLVDYYANNADLWEIQALLKARTVAGNLEVGDAFLKKIKPLLFKKYQPCEVISNINKMRENAISITNAENGIDVKDGYGGMRDIEFLVQGLQLIYASQKENLLTGNTRTAILSLGNAGILPEEVSKKLLACYDWLRRVEHFLQLFEDRQIHRIPAEQNLLNDFVRRIKGKRGGVSEFMEELGSCQKDVRSIYEKFLSNSF